MSARPGSRGDLFPAYRVLTVVTAVGVLVQAVLASQGVWGGHQSFISVHGQIGNVMFLLAAAQTFLALQLGNSGAIPRVLTIVNALVVVLVVVQIALGYSKSAQATAWHVPNGVLLMGLTTVLAAIACSRSKTVIPRP